MANIDAGINSLLLEKILRDMQAAQGAPVKRLSIDEINQSMKRTTPEKKKKVKKKPIETTLPTRIDKNAKPLDPLGLKRTALDNRLSAMGKDPLTWLKQKAMDNIQAVKPVEKGVSRYGYATAEQNIAQKKQVQAPFNDKYMNPSNSTARKAVTELAKPIAGAGAFIGGNLAKGLLVNQTEGLPTTAAGVRAWFQNLVGDKEGSKNTLDMVDNPDAPLVYDANGKQRPYKETGGNYLYVQDGKKWKLVPYKAGDQGKFYTKASGMFGDIYSKYDGQGSIELQKGNDLITQGLNQMQGNEVYDKLNETGAGGIMLKDILQGVGEQGWNAAFQAVAPGAGYAIMGVNSAGNKIRERADQGDRDINNIMANAGLSGAATALIEKTSGGLGGFGKTNPVVRGLTKNIKNIFIKNGIKVAGNVIGESGEEVEDAFAQGVIDYFLNNKEDKTIAQLFADNKPLEAAVSAAIISGLTLGGSGVNATTNGVDIETGLTNEQTKFVEGLAKSQKNEKGKSIGFDKAVEVYQKNKALESQIGFTPDFDEQSIAPENQSAIPLRFTTTGNKRVDDFNAMQSKVLKNTPEDRNQAYNNIRTVMELGIDEFILSDKEVQQMNKPTGTGAFWNERLNAVVVNAETKRSFASKLFHEFAHIRENSSVQSELANMVIAYRNANPTTLKDGTTETAEQEMARIKDTYEKAGVQLSEQELRNEFVAEELARLSDKDAKFYQSVFNESPTVFQRLGQYVQKKLGFLKEGSEEQQYFRKIQELQKKAYDEVKNQRKQKQDAKNSDKNLIEDNEAKSIKDKAEKMFKAANIKEVKRPAIKDVKDLTVYHGSSATDIKQFDFEKAGRNTRSGEKGIVYFTENRQLAKDMFAFERISTDSNFYDKIGAKGTVYESKITMNKPLDLRNLSVKEAMMIAENDPNKMATPEMVLYLSKVPNGQMLKPLINVEAYKKEGYDGIIADMDKNGNIEYGVFSNEQINIVDDKYLIEDNLGRELSPGQQEFFKDSKVRDEEGRLLTVYHGTNAKFSVFKDGLVSKKGKHKIAYWFTPNVEVASGYAAESQKTIMKTYVDMKNPLTIDAKESLWNDIEVPKAYGIGSNKGVFKRVKAGSVARSIDPNATWDYVPVFNPEIDISKGGYYRQVHYYDETNNKIDIKYDLVTDNNDKEYTNTDVLSVYAKDNGYDGIIVKNVRDGASQDVMKNPIDVYGAFNSNQIKSVDNLNPTEDDDIRYLIEDNYGYHAGDLGKAEYLGRMTPGRGTGHFGTGTYFVGDKEKIDVGGYNDRPQHKVDFSDYKLFRPYSEDYARKVHRYLKEIDDSNADKLLMFSSYEASEKSFDSYMEKRSALTEKKYGSNTDEEYEKYDELINELDDEWEMLSRYRNSAFMIDMYFDTTSDKVEKALREVIDYQSKHKASDYIGNSKSSRMDSYATVFMKSLGYEGVDVRNIKSMDDTEYGSVIYDLKQDSVKYLIEDPRLDGDFSNISDRATKSMVKQFPELAPYLKEMAGYMQMEVEGGFRGGRSVAFDYNGDAVQTGGKRFVIADDIASILDSKIIKSYAHLSETLQDIQNGEGWNAAAKYLEMYLDERLTNGYTTDGMDIPPNEAYVGMKEMLKKGIIDNTIEGQLPYSPDKWNEYEPTGKDQAEYEAMQGLAPIRKEPSQKDVDEYAEMQGLVPIREDLKPNKFTAMKESSAKALSELEKTRDTIVSEYNQKINQAKIELHKKKRLSKQGANLQARIIRLEKMRDDRIAEFDARIARQESQVEKRTVTEEEQMRIERGKEIRKEYTDLAEKYTDNIDNTFKERRGVAIGLRYILNSPDRNFDRVSTRREIADNLKRDYVKSVEGKLIEREDYINKHLGKLKDIGLNKMESEYAAMYWELKYNPASTVQEWQVKQFYQKHKQSINQGKVDVFLKEASISLEQAIADMNAERARTGRKLIPHRAGYMPHFNLNLMKGGVWDVMQLFGVEVQRDGLPTSIAGKTEGFKPIAPYNPFSNRRTGDKTEYNILKAVEMYMNKAADEIYMTEEVMKWRYLENSIRSKYDPEALKKKIEEIKNNDAYDELEKLDEIDGARESFKKNNENGGGMPYLVTWVMNQANLLANKKNQIDRLGETLIGRHILSAFDQLHTSAVGNMLTSAGTALSQLAPMVNASATYGYTNMAKGITQMLTEEAAQLKAYLENESIENQVGLMSDSVVSKSSFAKSRLTKRIQLDENKRAKIRNKAFELTNGVVDGLITNIVIRGGYNKGLSMGMTEDQAIAYADESARALMQDRSKAHIPQLFDSKLLKIFTAFNIEPLNDIFYGVYDAKKYVSGGGDDDKKNAFIAYIIRYLMGAYLINAFTKSTKGSKIIFSPLDIVLDAAKVVANEDLSNVDKVSKIAANFGEQLPFSFLLDWWLGLDTSGAAFPVQAMFPKWQTIGQSVKRLGDDNEDNDTGAKYDLYKELSKPFYYFLLPAFGGQIKKSIEGIGQYYEITDKGIEKRDVPGSYTSGGDLRYEVPDTPEAKGQALLFGQYSSGGAREYFDTGAKPTSPETLKAAKEADLAPTEYKKIKKKAQEIDTNKDGKSTYEEKLNYLESLDIPVDSKTAIANDIAPTREYKVDMKEYDKMSGLEEYDLYLKDRGQWEAITNITNYMHYKKIESNIEELTSVPEMENESTSVRAQAVYDYVMSTNLDYDKKLMLIKSKYSNYKYSTAKKYEPYIAELDKVVLDSIDSMKISKEAKKSLASKYKFKYFEWRGYGW